jgi:hypothetical protein
MNRNGEAFRAGWSPSLRGNELVGSCRWVAQALPSRIGGRGPSKLRVNKPRPYRGSGVADDVVARIGKGEALTA